MRAILKRAIAFALTIVGVSGYSSAAFSQAPAATSAAPATAADMKAGAQVRDSKGVQVATIVEMQGANVVLDTGRTKVAIPMTLMIKDNLGVMLNITADQFHDAMAKAHARAEAAKAQQPPQQQQQQPQSTPPKH